MKYTTTSTIEDLSCQVQVETNIFLGVKKEKKESWSQDRTLRHAISSRYDISKSSHRGTCPIHIRQTGRVTMIDCNFAHSTSECTREPWANTIHFPAYHRPGGLLIPLGRRRNSKPHVPVRLSNQPWQFWLEGISRYDCIALSRYRQSGPRTRSAFQSPRIHLEVSLKENIARSHAASAFFIPRTAKGSRMFRAFSCRFGSEQSLIPHPLDIRYRHPIDPCIASSKNEFAEGLKQISNVKIPHGEIVTFRRLVWIPGPWGWLSLNKEQSHLVAAEGGAEQQLFSCEENSSSFGVWSYFVLSCFILQ